MRCRILQHLFICIILLAFAESWWGSSSSSSRTTGSTGRTSVSTSRRTGSSGKSTGWFWGRRSPGSTRRTTGSTRRTTGSTRKTTGSPRKSTGWFWSRRRAGLTRRTTGSTRRTTGSSRKSTGWFWRRRRTGSTRKTTGSARRTTGSSRKSTGWFWRRRRTGSTRRTSNIKPNALQSKVSTVAHNYLKQKSTKWATSTTWNGKYRDDPKCNLFVADVLKEAGVEVPVRSDGLYILANTWATPNSEKVLKTGQYEQVSLKDIKPGDIIAFKRDKPRSGHVGIVSKDRKFINAGSYIIKNTSIDKFRMNPSNQITDTVVWRIKKKT